MKSLIKFFPVAVGALALASCSNDDFLGSNNEDGKLELVATVVAPAGSDDGLSTRSVITPAENVADYQSNWQSGDVFRVYDAALQKYDAFSYKSGKVTIDTESPKVDEYAKAIFPGESVSYAGWSAKNDAVTATVLINPTITYEPAVKVGEKTAYVSNLPMWGDATMKEDHLATELNPLTAYADITVNGAYTSEIRVISANTTSLDNSGNTITAFEGSIAAGNLSIKAPLTGYFDALLKTNYEDSYLVADYTAPLKDKYGYIINVNMGTNAADEAHVIIPIIPQTYEYLIIQYYDATTSKWVTKKEYKNQAVANNVVLRKDLSIGDAIVKQDAKVSTFADINTRLTKLYDDYNTGIKVYNLDLASGVAADAIKTSADKQTITIPDFGEEKIINLNFDIDDTDYNLTIENQNTAATVLNLKTIKGNSAVTIKQGNLSGTNAFVITGEINSTGSGEYKRLIVEENGNLTFGLGDFGPFKSNMNLYLKGNVNALTIAAAEGNTIAAIDASAAANNSNIDVVSGTVTAIGGTTAAAIPVTVEDGATVGSVKTTADVQVKTGATATSITTTTGNVTVEGDATATSITTTTGAVTVNKGATVKDITTGAATSLTIYESVETITTASTYVTATATTDDMTIGTLTFKDNAAATLTLTSNSKKLLKVTNLATVKVNSTAAVNVTPNGKVAIVNYSKGSGSTGCTFQTSTLVNKAAEDKTTEINSKGEIYTAAQLAGVTTGKNYKLMASIDANNKEWTPLNLNGNFDGNGKTISNVKVSVSGGLFGTISGGEVKNLTISIIDVAKKQTGDMGALAAAATGTVAVTGVTITGATIGKTTPSDVNNKNINYGGLFGTTNGTITLTDNKISATINGYANMGGYIGNVKGGSVNILTSADTDTDTKQSAITFALPVAPNAANAGTIGNFIGTISGNGASVSIGGTADGKGRSAATFFDFTSPNGVNATNAGASGTLKYFVHKNSANKTFKGMTGTIADQTLSYEIGRCTATSLGTIFLYNRIEDELGNEYQITIDDINKYNN